VNVQFEQEGPGVSEPHVGFGDILKQSQDANDGIARTNIPVSWIHPVGMHKVVARIWDRLPDVSGKLWASTW
jgi:hypothetical protein